MSQGLACSDTRGLFGVLEGRRGEDVGFTVCICSSIDGQGCHAVSLVNHGGARREYGDFGDAVSGEWCVQVEEEEESIGDAAE